VSEKLTHWLVFPEHEVVCNCLFGETVAAEMRRLSDRTSSFATIAYGYAIAAALLAGTILLSKVI
jgi:hypothetical protein